MPLYFCVMYHVYCNVLYAQAALWFPNGFNLMMGVDLVDIIDDWFAKVTDDRL